MEGSGGIFLPFDLGLKYYFTKKRFRPLVGFGVGSVSANFQYILLKEIYPMDFQNRTSIKRQSEIWKIYTGFDYRLGKGSSLNLNLLYYSSGTFKEPIGGYSRYQGFVINTGFSIIL
jgi:outer membrane protein W